MKTTQKTQKINRFYRLKLAKKITKLLKFYSNCYKIVDIELKNIAFLLNF